MSSHRDTDLRSLALSQAVADKIDNDPSLLAGVRDWAEGQEANAYREWQQILKGSWPQIREVLLEESDEGQRLRQSSPFVGILSPQERWKFFPVTS